MGSEHNSSDEKSDDGNNRRALSSPLVTSAVITVVAANVLTLANSLVRNPMDELDTLEIVVNQLVTEIAVLKIRLEDCQ
jgi:hypothetical protein